MQGARDEFFAGARLADDQDRGVMTRHSLNHQHEPLHRFAAEYRLGAWQIEYDGLVIHLW